MSWSINVTIDTPFNVRFEAMSDHQITALIGPNGSGKTTLMRAIAGLGKARGEITVGDSHWLNSDRCADPADRNVGYVPQNFGLFPHLTAQKNIEFAGRNVSTEAWIERLQCGALLHKLPAALSGGEQQRVALCRALNRGPKLLLLDEPMSSLDVSSKRAMRDLLATIAQETAILLVTHDARDIKSLDAHVVELECGRVVTHAHWKTVSTEPKTEFAREFFG